MKKVILSVSGILMSLFFVVMIVNAQDKPQEVKKATTEVSKDCPKGPSASCCAKMAESKSAEARACDPAKCKGAAGETMKCDPAACKGGAKKP